MKKLNVLISVSVFLIIFAGGLALADSSGSDNSTEYADPAHEMPITDQSYDSANPNSALYRSNRNINTRNYRTITDCSSTDLECMHNLRTGPGQDSY